ncbi:hypothetical protein DS745_22040 [Anaerobacillus alkaliphilus]|uniref:Tetratricopeptide repeat protein n=1 Tax=Anaerobacillus alkaliphilus TaxID=1548597 RepID=A0A4Q0VM22_9BACI|nr:hypothetical protein [Anaerobacillus alkaliphilus]RXI96398.1 hypothetical protein DS745_22040 [Anaerobacillus alkaliphilus]
MRFFTTFMISLGVFLLLTLFNINGIFSFITIGILILFIVMYPILHGSFLETNIDKIEKFLLKNKHNPNLYIIYALANERDEEINQLTEQLISKTGQKSRQSIYKIIRSLYFKDVLEAKKEIQNITAPEYKHYYQALILLEENRITEADPWIGKVSKPWMKYALLAERAKKQGNLDEACAFATKAKQQTKGLQHYLLHKTYEREFKMY